MLNVEGFKVYLWLFIRCSLPTQSSQEEEEEDRKPTPNNGYPMTPHTAFRHLTRETLGNSLCLGHHTRGNLLTMTIGY